MPDRGLVLGVLEADLAAEGARFLLDPQMNRFRDQHLAEALAYWRAKAAAVDGIPPRHDFSPQAVRPFLRKVALFEIIPQICSTSRLRARLTGQEFAKTYTEMSGRFVDEVVPKKFVRRWTLIADAVLAYQRPFRMISVPEAFGRDHSVAELLLAPFSGDAGVVNQILVVCSFEFGASWQRVRNEKERWLERFPQTGCDRADAPVVAGPREALRRHAEGDRDR